MQADKSPWISGCLCTSRRATPGAHSLTEGSATSSASLYSAQHREAWHGFCWNEKIGRAALDNSTAKHCGRRFGLHTKAAKVLIAFSVIAKKALNSSLHVFRMTDFCSASSEHSASHGKERLDLRGKTQKTDDGSQLVLQKEFPVNCFGTVEGQKQSKDVLPCIYIIYEAISHLEVLLYVLQWDLASCQLQFEPISFCIGFCVQGNLVSLWGCFRKCLERACYEKIAWVSNFFFAPKYT